jgi:hypothetical protein
MHVMLRESEAYDATPDQAYFGTCRSPSRKGAAGVPSDGENPEIDLILRLVGARGLDCVALSAIARGHAMKLLRRQFLHLAAGAAAVPAVSRMAKAQAYPTKPVRMSSALPPAAEPTFSLA